jgi:hypothetical protein
LKQNHEDKIGILKKPIKTLGFSIIEIIYIIVYLIVIVTAMVVIHETGHILGALAAGIPLAGMKVGISGSNPEVILPSITNGHFSQIQLEIFYYGGGFLSATFLACVYFLFIKKKYRVQPSVLFWFLGFITAGLCTYQIGNAIVEGGFHARYIYYSNMGFSVLDIYLTMFFLFGLILHYFLFKFPKSKKKTSE